VLDEPYISSKSGKYHLQINIVGRIVSTSEDLREQMTGQFRNLTFCTGSVWSLTYKNMVGAGRLGSDSQQEQTIILFASVQTGSGAHPAS
jgi:hypothetical protein